MADVSATFAAWSATTNSNSPAGTATVGTGVDDNMREIQGVIVRGLSNKGSDITSATTTDLGAVEGLMHDITGATPITGFGTVRAGIWKIIKFEGALTLTHNATSLILPGGVNITTADGDIAVVISEGSGNWRCVTYFRAAAQPVQAASDTVAGVIEYAVQSEQETATSNTLAVTPGRQHFHPSAAKGFGVITPATTVTTSYPASGVSVVKNSDGDFTITHGLTFSSANYVVSFTPLSGSWMTWAITAITTTTVRVIFHNNAGAATDPTTLFYVCFGDL